MNRPYILCHMLTSIDGKVTGDFLNRPECKAATDVYYELNRYYKRNCSWGFICGRETMETSFTGGYYPDLTNYKPVEPVNGHFVDRWFEEELEDIWYFAIAFDPKGKLGWRSNSIEDSDPGYAGAMIIEVLTEQVDPRYLAYLEEKQISYIFAGTTEIDVPLALKLLNDHILPAYFVLEGGSITNGYFMRADCIDEICLVQAPVTADKDSKPLFWDGGSFEFGLYKTEQINGVLVTRYERKSK